jgi:carbon monoxide dehydrogenase subunit G
MRLTRELHLAAPPERVWPALAAIAPLRGTVSAGTRTYTGTCVVDDADDHERVATLRLQGSEAGGHATAAATIVAAVRADGASTELTLTADVARGHGGSPLPDAAVAAVLDQLAATLAGALAPEAPPPDAPPGRRRLVIAGVAAVAVLAALRRRR